MNVYDKEKSEETELEHIASKESDAGVLSELKNSSEVFESEQKSLEKSFYNPNSDEEYEKIKISGNKKKAGIGAGVLVVLFGGGIGIFSMLAQPLQFIQMSSMLRNFHFSDGENFSDRRMTKIARYIRYGNTHKTRLSYIGNKYADRLEGRLLKSGLQSTYTGQGSTFSGYIIDPDNAESSKTLGDIKNKTPDEIKSDLNKKYGIDPGKVDFTPEGKLKINADAFSLKGNINSQRLMRTALQDAGYSKIGAAMRARVMGKRAGVTWNPLKVLDRKITKSVSARIADFKEARAKRINNGTDVSFKATGEKDPDTDADGNPTEKPNPTNDGAADEMNKLRDGPDTPKTNIKNKMKAAGKGLLGIGIICAMKSLADGYDTIKHANVVLPLMRIGVEALAVGDQIVTGQNLDPAHIDAMTELMYDEDLQTSWRSARSIQAEAGENLTGEDISDEARINSEGNIFTKIFDLIPGLGGVCKVTNGIIGQVVGVALSWSGPVALFGDLIKDYLSGMVVGKLADGLINWLAGNPIDVEVAGVQYGNYINFGARLAANDSAIASGGRKLSGVEVAELKSIRLKDEQIDFNQKSFVAKIFDAKDYRTPAGKFIANQAPNPAQNIARVVSEIPKSTANIFSPIRTLVSQKTSAESAYDYGFNKYGFSVDEEEKTIIENPFENDAYVENLLNTKANELSETTTKCFGIQIVKKKIANDEVWTPVSVGEVPKYVDIEKEPKCSDTSEEFLRIRMWIHDTQLISSYACFEDGADDSCVEFGLAPDTGASNGSNLSNATSTGMANVNCDGYLRLASAPAILDNGFPTNTEITPYSQTVKNTCNSVKEQCLAGVADTTKILCSALEFHDSWYGNIYSKYGSVSSNQYYYGISTISNALYDPGRWYSYRKLGINSTNVLDCSALTAVALYRAYSYSTPIGCSGSWGQSSKPNLFRDLAWEEIKPGDFLTFSKSCNSDGFGHIAIAASTVAPDGSFVVFEQSAYGTTAHFKLANKKTWGIKSGVTSTFSGHLSRWIGPGAN